MEYKEKHIQRQFRDLFKSEYDDRVKDYWLTNKTEYPIDQDDYLISLGKLVNDKKNQNVVIRA